MEVAACVACYTSVAYGGCVGLRAMIARTGFSCGGTEGVCVW
jgi:hypothetical protein